MVEAQQNFEVELLISRLHDGGDFEVFDELVINGLFDQKYSEKEGDMEICEYVRHVHENMTKVDSIHEGIRKGDIRGVKNLIDLKKLIAAPGRDGRNALSLAICCGQTEIAKYLIQSYPKCINHKDKVGRTAMHYAAALNDPDISQLLMEKGGDENVTDMAGHLPEYYKDQPDELPIDQNRCDS